MISNELSKEILDEIQKRTQKDAISISINPDREPKITDSKFGGFPYWDLSMDYPQTSDGEKLALLAQINLDELNEKNLNIENKLPKSGMLQFFISFDDVYGLDFDNPVQQNTFRVVYHEKIDYSVNIEALASLDIPNNLTLDDDKDYLSPVYGEYAVDLSVKKSSMRTEDYKFDKLFREIAAEKGIKMEEGDNFYNILDEDVLEDFFDEDGNTDHWMLGYPFFTQWDPRAGYDKDYSRYDTMLFQMDSDGEGGNDYVLWGDCGVANFFINHEDLAKGDFSDILYNWDCC